MPQSLNLPPPITDPAHPYFSRYVAGNALILQIHEDPGASAIAQKWCDQAISDARCPDDLHSDVNQVATQFWAAHLRNLNKTASPAPPKSPTQDRWRRPSMQHLLHSLSLIDASHSAYNHHVAELATVFQLNDNDRAASVATSHVTRAMFLAKCPISKKNRIEKLAAMIWSRQILILNETALAADDLAAKYHNVVDHPVYPRDNWIEDVRDGHTVQGYWEWIASAITRDSDPSTYPAI